MAQSWLWGSQIVKKNVTKFAVSADLVTFTEGMLNGKLHFCAVEQSPKVFSKKGNTRKHLCWSILLISKRDSDPGVFLRILQKFSEQIFHRRPPGACLRAPEKLWSFMFLGSFLDWDEKLGCANYNTARRKELKF